MQISPGAQNGVKISHNWVTDSPKKGLRFDGNGHPLGLHGFQVQYTKRILNRITLFQQVFKFEIGKT